MRRICQIWCLFHGLLIMLVSPYKVNRSFACDWYQPEGPPYLHTEPLTFYDQERASVLFDMPKPIQQCKNFWDDTFTWRFPNHNIGSCAAILYCNPLRGRFADEYHIKVYIEDPVHKHFVTEIDAVEWDKYPVRSGEQMVVELTFEKKPLNEYSRDNDFQCVLYYQCYAPKEEAIDGDSDGESSEESAEDQQKTEIEKANHGESAFSATTTTPATVTTTTKTTATKADSQQYISDLRQQYRLHSAVLSGEHEQASYEGPFTYGWQHPPYYYNLRPSERFSYLPPSGSSQDAGNSLTSTHGSLTDPNAWARWWNPTWPGGRFVPYPYPGVPSVQYVIVPIALPGEMMSHPRDADEDNPSPALPRTETHVAPTTQHSHDVSHDESSHEVTDVILSQEAWKPFHTDHLPPGAFPADQQCYFIRVCPGQDLAAPKVLHYQKEDGGEILIEEESDEIVTGATDEPFTEGKDGEGSSTSSA